MRQYIVQHTKDALFHFSCVSRTAYQDYLTGKVYYGKVGLACTIYSRVGLEARCLQYQPVRVLRIYFFSCRAQEKVVAEKVSPWGLVHYADVQAVFRIGTSISIAYPYLL